MFKKFKKPMALAIVSLMLAAAFSFSGCSSVTTQNNSQGQITITVMQQNDPSHNYFTTLGEEFTKTHPNIKINYIGVPYDDFDSKFMTMLASGTQPDITTHVQLMGFMDYYSKGLLTDLNPYIGKYNFDNKKCGIPDNIMNVAKIDGKQYGIPLNTFTSVLLYNKDLFDKAGVAYPPSDYNDTSWTFDKMVEVAGQLTSGTDQNKIYGLLWSWDGGGAMQDPDYFGKSLFQADAAKTGKATANYADQPDVFNVYQRIADLAFKDGVSPTPAYVTALAGSNSSDPFLSGRIAMEVEGGWGLAGINDLPFKVGVAAIPLGGNPNARAVTYVDPYFILKGSKNPDAAFQYLSFLAEPENQIKMVQQSGGNPPSSTLALSAYYKNFPAISEAEMKNVIEGSYPYSEEDLEHLITGSGQIHNLLANELSTVFDGTSTAEKVCVPLKDKINDMLKTINK